jgi:hypothetical protein
MSEVPLSKKALLALRNYRKAVEEHAFLGGHPPAMWPAIQRDLEKAEAEIKKYLVRSDHDPQRT